MVCSVIVMAEDPIERCAKLQFTKEKDRIIDLGNDVPIDIDDKLSLRLVGFSVPRLLNELLLNHGFTGNLKEGDY